MLKQLERLKLLYGYLQNEQADSNTILAFLVTKKAEISLRQLQRDLKDVESYFLKSDQKLMVTNQSRKKIYQITKPDLPLRWNQKTINTWQLSELIGGVPLLLNRAKDIEAKKNVFKKLSLLAKGNKIEFNSNGLLSTNFYEVLKDDGFNLIMDDLMKAIRHDNYIKIVKIKNDFTTDNVDSEKNNIVVAPIAIFYHRGDFFIAVMEKKAICFYEIGQLNTIEIIDRKFNRKDCLEKLEKERKRRFGVTKNINNEVYDIKLEFTNITGSLVKKYFWHSTQKFYQKTANDNVIMTLQCGINRELVGWIFQWMYNVRILEPLILKEYYSEAIKKMNKIDNTSVFVYNNIFEP